MKPFLIAMLAASMVVCTAAFAQEEPPANSLRWFESFDLNKDGFITPEEMETAGASESMVRST